MAPGGSPLKKSPAEVVIRPVNVDQRRKILISQNNFVSFKSRKGDKPFVELTVVRSEFSLVEIGLGRSLTKNAEILAFLKIEDISSMSIQKRVEDWPIWVLVEIEESN